MNLESQPNNQIHLDGWMDCGDAEPTTDADAAIFCPRKLPPRTRGMWHKYELMDKGSRRPDCPAELVFTKSNRGGGMEIQCAHPDRITYNEEELSWTRLDIWRVIFNSYGQQGYTWTLRGVPAGKVFAQQGSQQFKSCSDISGVLEEYPVFNAWSILGPYDISTTDGLAAAERDLAPYVPPGYPVIEPSWRTFNTQVPGGHASDHVFVWMRTDSWALKPGYDPARHEEGLATIDAWSKTESHYYVGTGTAPDALWRGLGLAGWRLRRNNLDGSYTYLLQVIADRVVLEAPGEIQYGVCKNNPTVAGATIDASETGTVRAENRAARAYNWGDLPLDGLTKREWERVKREYRRQN